MILIHGDCGVGKSAALRALESDPPHGWRGAYVPVPTLDFPGIAGWCAQRLGGAPEGNPIAALRAAQGRERLLLLVDDADRLPLDTARDLAAFERTGSGMIAIIAACVSGATSEPSVAALGPPVQAIEVLRGDGKHVSAELREQFEARRVKRAPGAPSLATQEPAPPAPVPASSPAEGSGPTTAPAAPDDLPRHEPAAAPAPSVAPPASAPDALPAAAPAPRTVPLWLAVLAAATAFLMPLAFFTGYWLGRSAGSGPPSRTTDPLANLPAVASPPPAEASPEPAALPAKVERARAVRPRPVHTAQAQREPVATRERPPERIVTADARQVPRPPPEGRSPVEAEAASDWEPPTLISVAPATAGP